MNQVIHDRMKALRDDTLADSLTEVVRRALAIYEYLWRSKKDGGTIYLQFPDGERERLELLLGDAPVAGNGKEATKGRRARAST